MKLVLLILFFYSFILVEGHMFSPPDEDWGFTNFMALDTLKDPKQGYLVDDNCIIEAEVKFLRSDIQK